MKSSCSKPCYRLLHISVFKPALFLNKGYNHENGIHHRMNTIPSRRGMEALAEKGILIFNTQDGQVKK